MFNKWDRCVLLLSKRYLELRTQDYTRCIKHIPIPDIVNVSEHQESKNSIFCLKITVHLFVGGNHPSLNLSSLF